MWVGIFRRLDKVKETKWKFLRVRVSESTVSENLGRIRSDVIEALANKPSS